MPPRHLASPTAPTSPWRALLASALALVLFLGAVLPHEVLAAEHRDSPVDVAVDRSASRSASHPGDPVHVEPSAVEFQAACPLCVLQLQSRSVLHLPEAPLPPLLPCALALTAVAQADFAPPVRLGPARAPPRLSSAL